MKANSATPITITNKGPLDLMFCNVAIFTNTIYVYIISFLSHFSARRYKKCNYASIYYAKKSWMSKLFQDFEPNKFYFSGCHLNNFKLIPVYLNQIVQFRQTLVLIQD